MLNNKTGGFLDIFIFMIFSLVIVFILGIFVYTATTIGDKVKEQFEEIDAEEKFETNFTKTYENTFAEVPKQFIAFYWIAGFLMLGMILGIFIGSYLVTVKPIFFVPYIFIMIIAIVIAAQLSNAYEIVAENVTLGPTLGNFVSAHYIMVNLPLWITIIGFAGGIIMFVNFLRRREG